MQEFLQSEFDLHVTVSTISRQLSRAGHARARRPGYKNTRPDLQAQTQVQEQDQQQQPQQQQQQHQDQQQQQQQQQPISQESIAPIAEAQTFVTPSQPLQSPIQAQMQEGVEEDASNPTPQGAMKLACPFLKYNPQRYINGPFCQSSWHSVRDVKQVAPNFKKPPPPQSSRSPFN